MKRILSTLRRVIMSAVLLLAVCLLPFSDAELAAYAHDAPPAAGLKSKNGVISIEERLILSEDTTVGKNETLYVRDGGKLYVKEDAVLTVRGSLKCAEGGEIYSLGTIDAEDGSSLSISGKMKLMSGGSLKLGGELSVNKTGIVKGKGAVEVLGGFDDISCKGTVTAKIKAPEPVETDGVTSVGGIILVNKRYALPEDYGKGLNRAAYSAYLKMKKASGFDMSIVSGFRSYETQQKVFEYWCKVDGYDKASAESAVAGHSEHQTGLAMDISSLEPSYGETEEGRWLAENCWQYGFIIRYPKDKVDITGYTYEPWHVRYLGKSTAKLVHDSGLTLEEFLGTL